MAKWGSNPHSFQKTNLCNVYKGKTANLSFYIQSFKGHESLIFREEITYHAGS